MQGKQILEDAEINVVASNIIVNLPKPEDFDTEHHKWRSNVILAAQKYNLVFTHGVAAKLINIYLKSIFVCSNNHNDLRVKAIHPPIDSVLLDALYKQSIGGKRNEWQVARKARWSKLDSKQYESVISAIQYTIPYRQYKNRRPSGG